MHDDLPVSGPTKVDVHYRCIRADIAYSSESYTENTKSKIRPIPARRPAIQELRVGLTLLRLHHPRRRRGLRVHLHPLPALRLLALRALEAVLVERLAAARPAAPALAAAPACAPSLGVAPCLAAASQADTAQAAYRGETTVSLAGHPVVHALVPGAEVCSKYSTSGAVVV